MSQRPMPLNDAEGVIQRFYDAQRCRLGDWACASAPAAGVRTSQAFYGVLIAWDAASGGVSARLSRPLDFDLAGYDRLILCATLPATATVTVRATVDGQEQTSLARVQGTNTSEEWEGPVTGGHLTALTIEVTDRARDPANAALFWLGVAHAARRAELRTRPNPFRDAWADLLAPPGAVPEPRPTLGLCFGADDLARLRAKARVPGYQVLLDRVRQRAQAVLTKEPWRGVGRYPNHPAPRCYRVRETAHIDLLGMRSAAFIGLLDRDAALLRAAADQALALAHCETWQPEFQPTLPGSSWEQRAFYEYRYAQNAIAAWDWAGAYLTEPGRQLLAQAVATKALPWILQTLMRHRYIRGCNQGAYMAWGGLVCLLALQRVYPYAHEYIAPVVKALDETVNTCFAPDGGTCEGVGYASSTMGHALLAYHLLARHRGVPLRDMVPPVLLQSRDYFRTMLSTTRPYGAVIKVADGGRSGVCVYADGLGLLWQLTDDPGLAALLAGMVSEATLAESHATPGAIYAFVFGPDALPAPAATPPVFHVLPHTGQLCSCRPTPAGPVRLQLIGTPAGAGHAHEDKGSFVLEAFGEELACERGQMPYDDPRATTLKHARYHNLLIPADGATLFTHQVNPCPAAIIPTGRGDEQRLAATVDSAPAWGAAVTRCVRTIASETPTAFVITDEMALARPERVSFNLHSRFPWRQTDAGWVTTGARATLTVRPLWPPETASADVDLVDGDKQPVHHLVLVAPAAAVHRLTTELTVTPVAPVAG